MDKSEKKAKKGVQAGTPSLSKKESKITKVYGPTEQAKKSPVRLQLDGEWVAVGGSITVKVPAPGKNRTIKECTEAQYKKLYERGLKHLVKCSG